MQSIQLDTQDIIHKAKDLWDDVYTKLSTTTLKKSITYIKKILDFDKLSQAKYSYQTLVQICGNSIIRYPVIGSILILYIQEDEEYKKFIDNVEYNMLKIVEIKGIIKSRNVPFINSTSSEALNLLYDLIKDENIYLLEPKIIFEKIYNIYRSGESYVSLRTLALYIAHFISLKNEQNGESLKRIYENHIDVKNITSDVIFSLESTWKKNLIDHLRKINTERLDKTSAYPEVTLRKILARNVLLLRNLEKYIEEKFKHIPTSIDSIQWFFNTVTIEGLKEAIIYIGNNYVNPENERIKSKHIKHHGNDFVKTTIVFFRDRIPNYLNCKKDLHALNITEILGKINDLREIPVENVRRHFYADELEKILDKVKNDPKYSLIFTILIEVGLRVSALCTLQTKHFINHKGEYLDKCKKLEKGKKHREFPIIENLKEKVKIYLDCNEEVKNNLNSYLFPSKNGKCISPDAIRRKLTRITESLNINGQHVHPHAFRHTIVNSLMAEGNKLENVSKYMGHSSISTTEQYYWTTEIQNIIPIMRIPWLSNSGRVAYPENIDEYEEQKETENNDLSTDLLVSVIGAYHSVLDDEQKQLIKERIPNIENIFKNICEYSLSSSLSSRVSEKIETINDFI